MRIIQKKISLEPMTSRLPGVWPAYNGNTLLFFDEDSLEKRQYSYTSNYGLIPTNIILVKPISSITEYNDIEMSADKHVDCGCDCSSSCNFMLSYESISKIYYFFKQYYHLLNDYGHCGRTYYSAEDYYNYESETKYADQMIYGNDKQIYIDLDEQFKNYGGIPYFRLYNKRTSEEKWVSLDNAKNEAREWLHGGGNDKTDSIDITDARDEGFFKWICENLVPTFTIPLKYQDYWKTKYIYYPDVIKWLVWFKERLGYETVSSFKEGQNGEVDTWECKNDKVDNCCDCDEYFKRGGKRVYDLMKEWFTSVQKNISDINKAISDSASSCYTPRIIYPIELQVSIDDLGEYSIFSNEYELGIDYRTTNYGEYENTKQGTVVIKDGKSIRLTDGKGYTFDEVYMEKKFDESAWESYTDEYIGDNPSEFESDYFEYYAISDDGIVIKSTKSDDESALKDIKEKYKKYHSYPIIKSEYGWVMIDNVLYEIQGSEYGHNYITNKDQFVYREKYTNTPYTFINGEKIYGELNLNGANTYYSFSFFKDTKFGYNENSEFIKYIDYKGSTYIIKNDDYDSGLTVNDVIYEIISGYAETDDGILYILYSEQDKPKIINDLGSFIDKENSQVNGDEIELSQISEFKLYKVDEITGNTVSKLYDLRTDHPLIDDVGNNMEGIYAFDRENTYNHQPPEGSELNPLYQVGNTANVNRYTESVVDADFLESDTNYFVGDIIDDMVFYYKDLSTNEMVEETKFSPKDEGCDYNSLLAINKSFEAKKEIEEGKVERNFDEDIYCDITYYIGATLELGNEKQRYKLAENRNHGVKYTETVRFKKESREYYLRKPYNKTIPSDENKVSSHSISYPIWCYILDQDMTTIESYEYGNTYEVALAKFTANINLYNGNTWSYYNKYSNDVSERNNTEVMPVYREEYKLGTATMENVDSDIYIDRGINAAFEKHIKLGEITSLEALTNFGNGFFKIIEN